MKETKTMRCPYCGGTVELRRGSELFGANAKTAKVYVCSNYPICDAYVSAGFDGKPMGTLANKRLRELRVKAHREFDQLWKSGLMTRKWAYKWLSVRLNLSTKQCHIAKFDEKRCERVIKLCQEAKKKREEERAVC